MVSVYSNKTLTKTEKIPWDIVWYMLFVAQAGHKLSWLYLQELGLSHYTLLNVFLLPLSCCALYLKSYVYDG